ncbi:hypothetical protein SKAU_G00390700 [Synaphobranchus kaupii]|uniref:Uncharacterized protein n=1 Tax=Synaphobranchus kaupii TaxID=118154 RepID=A0A9Q1IBK1_SYNKA|nr:hypothetical protein SKAU_G00390700 [Synaphobranchus kaupii]
MNTEAGPRCRFINTALAVGSERARAAAAASPSPPRSPRLPSRSSGCGAGAAGASPGQSRPALSRSPPLRAVTRGFRRFGTPPELLMQGCWENSRSVPRASPGLPGAARIGLIDQDKRGYGSVRVDRRNPQTVRQLQRFTCSFTRLF